MFSLQDLLGNQQADQAVNQMSQNIGADNSAVSSAIQLALPMILSGLAKNSQSPQGAETLNSALEKDHDGGLLDNLMGYLGGAGTQTNRQTDGGGILSHIFGGSQTEVANQVSQKTGLNTGQVAQLLITLAPIVMSYLGKQKQDQNLDSGGLSSWLGGQQQQIQQSPQGGLINSILDSNGDGSVMDDLGSMAMNYMTGRK